MALFRWLAKRPIVTRAFHRNLRTRAEALLWLPAAKIPARERGLYDAARRSPIGPKEGRY